MENELKARITADISGFVAGMAKVESNLARAEAIFSKSAKSVFQIENALSKLSKQYKEGSISEAQFTKQADELSKSLIAQRDNMAAASREVDRLKKSIAAQQIKPAVQEIKNLGTSVAQTGGQIRGANNVALEFNRIIQDAPFGIIGVGNNIQQLTANFSQLSKNAGGSVPAIKAAFSALVTGPNIALLAVSALTTALTLYQMGVFGSTKEVNELKEAQDQLNKSLKETETIVKGNFYADFLKDLGLLGDVVTETGRALKNVPTNLPINEQLEKIAEAVKTSTKPELEVLADFLDKKYKDSLRSASNSTSDFEKSIAKSNASQYKEQLDLVNKQLKFYETSTKKAKTETEKFDEAIKKIFSENDFIARGKLINKAILDGILTKEDGARIVKTINDAIAQADKEELNQTIKSTLQPAIDKAINEINKELTDPIVKKVDFKIDFKTEKLSGDQQLIEEQMIKTQKEIKKLEEGFDRLIERNSLGILTQTAGAFGNEIAKSFETGNAVLDSFIRNLFRAIPQIISAYTKLSAARKAQATASLGASATEASGDAVVIGTKAAKALGPLGLALLPVFIAGALGIIASAFSKARSGGGGGGGGSAQSFGNLPGREFGGPVSKGQAYIVGEKRPEIFVPSTSGVIIPQMPKSGGVSTGSSGTMKIEVEVKGRIDGEVIRLSNKRAGTRVRNT